MAESERQQRQKKQEVGVTETTKQKPKSPLPQLSRDKLETLRQKLKKKFH